MTSDLRAATAAYRRAEKRTEQLRLKLADAIIEADKSGTRQVEIVAITGYTRERVRQILDPEWKPPRKRSAKQSG